MRYLNSYNLSPQEEPVFEVQPDYGVMMKLLVTEIQSLKTQLITVQKQVEVLEHTTTRSIDRQFPVSEMKNSNYSPIVKTAFRSLKWLFLFLAGFALACILAASFRVSEDIIVMLLTLLQSWFLPLAGVTFAVVAVAVLLESLK